MAARGSLLGDWEGKLDKLIHIAQQMGGSEVSYRLVSRARSVIASQQKREFKRAMGPDGETWAAAKDGGKPLDRSGSLRRSDFARVEGSSRVVFGFAARYAKIVDKGRGGVPPRNIVPHGARLGPVWGPRLIGSLRQMLAKMLKAREASAGGGAESGEG